MCDHATRKLWIVLFLLEAPLTLLRYPAGLVQKELNHDETLSLTEVILIMPMVVVVATVFLLLHTNYHLVEVSIQILVCTAVERVPVVHQTTNCGIPMLALLGSARSAWKCATFVLPHKCAHMAQ